MSTVADEARKIRQQIIANRVAQPSIRQIGPSGKQRVEQAIAQGAIFASGDDVTRGDSFNVNARPQSNPVPYAWQGFGAAPSAACPTGYQRDALGRCIVVIETGTVANSIPAEYRLGPTLSQFRPILDLNAVAPPGTVRESITVLKGNLRKLSKGLNGLGAASKRMSTGLNGLGLTVTTSPTISTGITTTFTTQQVIDGLNAQITTLNATVTKLQSDYAALDAACQKTADNLASRTAALNTCNANLASTKSALDAANARIATLTTQVNNLTATLNTRTADYNTQLQLVATRDATITQITATLADVRNQLAAAQASVTDLNSRLLAAYKQSDAQQTTITSTQTDLAAAKAAIDQLRAALAAATTDNQRLSQQVVGVTADRDRLTLDLSNVRGQLTTATSDASECQTALAAAKAENDALRNAVGAATQQLASANSAIAALKAVCSALSSPESSTALRGLAGLGVINLDLKDATGRWREPRRGFNGLGIVGAQYGNFNTSLYEDLIGKEALFDQKEAESTYSGPSQLAIGTGDAVKDYEALYARCIEYAKKIKGDLDAMSDFIHPSKCGIPKGYVPEGTVPKGYVPEGTVPAGYVPASSCKSCEGLIDPASCPKDPNEAPPALKKVNNWVPLMVAGFSAYKVFKS